ncbi:MAG TPA: hypothetical protein VG275_00355 [Solirubrobacteraceae bacterium]|jgi:hypothetical protein|nr:hypothetical protein [Solirubrobacteraceae bacterium]
MTPLPDPTDFPRLSTDLEAAAFELAGVVEEPPDFYEVRGWALTALMQAVKPADLERAAKSLDRIGESEAFRPEEGQCAELRAAAQLLRGKKP